MPSNPAYRIAILTSSDAGSRGERDDVSGRLLSTKAARIGTVVDTAILPDEPDLLDSQIRQWVGDQIDLVLSTGGTGLGPRDVMPEVTSRIIDREVPGMAEAMRHASLAYTPMGMLSRGLVGVSQKTLIINFPGSPKSIEQLWALVSPVIPHALDLIAGHTRHDS